MLVVCRAHQRTFRDLGRVTIVGEVPFYHNARPPPGQRHTLPVTLCVYPWQRYYNIYKY